MQQPHGEEMVSEGVAPRHDWGETASDVAEGAQQAASDAKRSARRMANEASQSLRDAKERMTAAYGRTAESAERVYRDARIFARENPGTAAAATFAAGIGVGLMLAPRHGLRVYRTGLVPVVAVALAHAVLDVFDDAR